RPLLGDKSVPVQGYQRGPGGALGDARMRAAVIVAAHVVGEGVTGGPPRRHPEAVSLRLVAPDVQVVEAFPALHAADPVTDRGNEIVGPVRMDGKLAGNHEKAWRAGADTAVGHV